jgi:hypothetical protein
MDLTLLPILIQNSSEITFVRGLARGVSSVTRLLPTQDKTNTEETRAYIHVSSGIQTHNPSVKASEDISWLRRHGY